MICLIDSRCISGVTIYSSAAGAVYSFLTKSKCVPGLPGTGAEWYKLDALFIAFGRASVSVHFLHTALMKIAVELTRQLKQKSIGIL